MKRGDRVMEDDRIIMVMDDGSEQEFAILESTQIAGSSYLLVTPSVDDEEEDGECYVLKDVSDPDSEEAIYESVDDDDELDAVFKVFEELLDGEISIER